MSSAETILEALRNSAVVAGSHRMSVFQSKKILSPGIRFGGIAFVACCHILRALLIATARPEKSGRRGAGDNRTERGGIAVDECLAGRRPPLHELFKVAQKVSPKLN